MTVVEHTRLKKCPFCNFGNINEDTITHHIKFTSDAAHIRVDVYKLDKSSCAIVEKSGAKSSPYGPYVRTEDLPLPWIRCLWCKYRDKIEFDISLHMLERHKKKLLKLPIRSSDRKRTKALSADFFTRFEPAMEFRLDVAVEMAELSCDVKGAVCSIQRQIVERGRKSKVVEQAGH